LIQLGKQYPVQPQGQQTARAVIVTGQYQGSGQANRPVTNRARVNKIKSGHGQVTVTKIGQNKIKSVPGKSGLQPVTGTVTGQRYRPKQVRSGQGNSGHHQ
jgi:hypothetical protein